MTSHDIAIGQMVKRAAEQGASDDFLAVLATDTDGRHHVRNEVARALSIGDPIDGRGGHFFSALFAGKTAMAHARADTANRRIMESAGIVPRDAA